MRTHPPTDVTWPLSPEQRAVLRAGQTADELPSVQMQARVEIHGALDERRLREAIDRIVARHEIFSHVFGHLPQYRTLRQWCSDDTPRAILRTEPATPETSLRGCSVPLVEALLTRRSERTWDLTLTCAAAVADRGTLWRLYSEIAARYADLDAVLEPAFPYTRFIEWRLALEEEGGEEARDYWTQHLRGMEQRALRLPYEWNSHSDDTARQCIACDLDAIPLERGLALGETLDTFAQAAWWALLARISGCDTFLGGWQHDCRDDYEAMADGAGVFEKILPLALTIDRNERFIDWQRRLQTLLEGHRDAQEHWPVDEPPERLHLKAGFVFTSWPSTSGAATQWRLQTLPQAQPAFELALQLAIDRQTPRVTVSIAYSSARYPAVAMERLLEQYVTLLSAALERPQAAIDTLAIVGESERAALLELSTATLDCGMQLLPQRIARRASDTPEAPALEGASVRLTYAQMAARVEQLARGLAAHGVAAGDLVALSFPRSVDCVLLMLATWRLRAAYVPIEREWPPARQALVIETAAPKLTVHAGPSEGAGNDSVSLAALEGAAADAVLPAPMSLATDVAYVLFTSGSTGTPKGVIIEHGQLLNYVAAASATLQLDRVRRWALTSTVAADLGNTALFGALFHGACLTVAEPRDLQDPTAFAAFLHAHAIDAVKMVPSHFDALLETPDTTVAQSGVRLPRKIILGGEPLPAALIERIRAIDPSCEICNHYGPTETCVGVMTHTVAGGEHGGDSQPLTSVLPNNRTYVLDAALRLVPTGALGELYIGGAQVCRGYLHGIGADRFVSDPFRPGERLYRSGDLARYRVDGGIVLAGRCDDQIKVRGVRIELAEIEAALSRQSGVRQCVVLARVVNNATELVAFIIGDEECSTDAGRQRLRAALAALLPSQMLPSRYVSVASFPRLANGKIDRQTLLASALAEPSNVTPPRDALEAVLVAGMATLLQRDQLGIHDDFLAHGGHSLLVIKLVAGIRRQLKVELTPGMVFDHCTAAALAVLIRERATDPAQLERLALAQQQLLQLSPTERAAVLARARAATTANTPTTPL